jgi:membrane-associated phospholipid phosphatase
MQLPQGSFPSGHVLNLTATFGFLIFLVYRWRGSPPLRWGLILLLAFPILTIGFARVYEGAHWASDVLGGYLLGSLCRQPLAVAEHPPLPLAQAPRRARQGRAERRRARERVASAAESLFLTDTF